MNIQYPFQRELLNDDIKREILLRIPDSTLFSVCSVNKDTANLCNDTFWWQRFIMKFGTDLAQSRKNGVEINYRDIYKKMIKLDDERLFMFCATFGYIDLIKIMAKQPDLINEYSFAMILAAENGHLSIVKYLLEDVKYPAGIHDLDDGALLLASTYGQLNVVKYLIERGGPSGIHAGNDDAVQSAAENGHLDVVKYLDEHGANIHTLYDYPLIKAARNGHLDVVMYLSDRGANIHTYNDDPMRSAAEYGHLDVVKYLVEYDDTNIPYNNEEILLAAIMHGHLDIVKYLIEQGADYNEYDLTTIKNAVLSANKNIVKYLLDINQNTPIDRNLYKRYKGIIDYAKYYGYDDIAEDIEESINKRLSNRF